MTVVGERLVYELNGKPCLPLELVEPPRQGLTVSRSFGQTLTTLPPIKEALVQFVGRAEEKLRRQRFMAGQAWCSSRPTDSRQAGRSTPIA
jgi:DNA polymerase V